MSTDAHSQPAGKAQELLYDSRVPTLSHAERARTLVESATTGTLSTLTHEPAGHPYGSLITFSMDDHSPIFFISELAEHTRNLRQDTRASLMVAEGGGVDPLANGRVTLLGLTEPITEKEHRERARKSYLAAHPSASHYIDYSDFSFWRLEVNSLRYIGGYGRMSWVDSEQWKASDADPIAPLARGILDHMNEDHGETMVAYCKAFSRATDTKAAIMTAVDRYGFEMSAETGDGARPIRLAFSKTITTAGDARRELVEMAGRARESLAKQSSS